MKRIALWAVLGVALAGCIVPSVYPFYTEKDVVFDAALLGTWKDAKPGADDRETWVFAKDGEKAYTFTLNTETETNVFSAHLFKLKDQPFLDCRLVGPDDSTRIPPHYLMKVDQIRPNLKWTTLNVDWLKDYLEKNPDAIRHTLAPNKPGDTDEHVVLTADTRDLQKFILKHLDETNVFIDVVEMKPAETK